MASSMLGNKGTRRGEPGKHPIDRSILLAFIRSQHIENEAGVKRHLSECSLCQQQYIELKQTSRTLDVAAQMALCQRYSEQSASEMLEQIQQGKRRRTARERQRAVSQPAIDLGMRSKPFVYSRPSPLRWVSVPVALALFCVTIVIVLAFAFSRFTSAPISPFGGPNGTVVEKHPVVPVSVPAQQASPTQAPVLTPSAITDTATPTNTTEPTISDCTSPNDRRAQRLVICGTNFPAGDKISLILIMPHGHSQPSFVNIGKVNASGGFTYKWIFAGNCSLVPITIAAVDKTNSLISSNPLTNLSVLGCSSNSQPGS